MRIIAVLLFATILFQGARVSGQSLSLVTAPSISDNLNYAPYRDDGRHHMCAVHIIGLSAMGVGIIAIIAGIVIIADAPNSPQPNASDNAVSWGGAGVVACGGLFFYAGAGMAIGGGIHDRRMRRLGNWGLVVPRKNQIGLAYNF